LILLFATIGRKKMTTMDEKYGDGSDHEVCDECGLCKECGDCEGYGCGGLVMQNYKRYLLEKEDGQT